MHELTLDDGRVVTLRRISDRQLASGPGTDFGASRQNPLLLRVVAVNGTPRLLSHLVVMDTHSLWLSHQAEIAPESNGKPEAITGLTPAEALLARELFLSLVPEERPTMAAGTDALRPKLTRGWLGNHASQVIVGVFAAVLAAIILAWLGIKN